MFRFGEEAKSQPHLGEDDNSWNGPKFPHYLPRDMGLPCSSQLVFSIETYYGWERHLTLPLAEPPGRDERCLSAFWKGVTIERTSYANNKGITNPLPIFFIPNKGPGLKQVVTRMINAFAYQGGRPWDTRTVFFLGWRVSEWLPLI